MEIDIPQEFRPKRGRPAKVVDEALIALQVFLFKKLTALLDEMQWFLFDSYGIDADLSVISRSLRKAGWSRKKVARKAL